MTYITYEKAQYQIGTKRVRTLKRLQLFHEPRRKIPAGLRKPNFMPSYLVRTSDMKVVQGSDVHEGYCTLSYSWNQSGEISINETTGKSYRIDQGKHKIIFPEKFGSIETPIPDEVRFVTFEGLIQEICKDFNIKYIWYDQMCINQNDEKEKHGEIHQMHKIYSKAYCTLALVPELETGIRHPMFGPNGTMYREEDYFSKAEWMKRMWTLEESVMSSKILFVGRDIHCWSDNLLNPIFHNKFRYDAAIILYYAHARTSSKEHDHIFALANIFPSVIKDMKIDYNQDIQELMIQFYGLLAKKDLSVLCFEMDTSLNRMMKRRISAEAEYNIPIKKFDLPSWTGVNGQHWIQDIFKTPFKNYTVSGKVLQITCRGITNGEHRNSSLESIKDMIPPLSQHDLNAQHKMILVMHVRRSSTAHKKVIQVYTMYANQKYFTEYDINQVKETLWAFSHFLPIEKIDLEWVPGEYGHFLPSFNFDYLAELYQDAQYVLLSGVQFTSDCLDICRQYPVIKKDGDYYKAIGMCEIIYDDGHFLDDFTLEEKTFEIH